MTTPDAAGTTVARPNLDRLIALGRRRGSLTVDDLDKNLALETLSRSQLADILKAIENAGVSVEIDPALMTERPGHERRDVVRSSPASAEESIPVNREKLASLDSSIRRLKRQAAATSHLPHQHRGGTVFLAAAVLTCILLLVALWLLDKGI